MSLPSTTVLRVWDTGADTNAGGYNPARVGAGTNYSKQAAAQAALSDVVINGSDSTLISSAARPFSSADIGNLYRQTGGVGFTVGVFEIVSVDGSNRAVLDRSAGTLGSTGGTGNLGGALATLGAAATIAAAAATTAGVTTYIKGSFTTAATITLSRDSSDNLACSYIGYGVNDDDGVLATITSTNAAATSLISVTGKGSILKNLKGDGASLSQRVFNAADITVTFDSCWGLGGTKYGFRGASTQSLFRRCLATGNGASGGDAGFAADTGTALFDRCEARGNAGNGFSALTAGVATCLNCIAAGNTLSGFYSNDNESVVRLLNCTAYGNTLDGLRYAAVSTFIGTLVRNSIFYGNLGYGIRSISTDYNLPSFVPLFESNALGANTLGARFQVPTGAADIALTLDPFTDAAGGDFSLNLSEGGGLELRATGVPGGFGLRTTPEASVGYSDIGAVPASGATSSSTALGTMRSLFRELTGEKFPGPVPDSVVDEYLNLGLFWYNQATEYHWTTSDGGVTLAANVQEYDLAATVVRVDWVELNGVRLSPGDTEEWDNRGEPWRSEAAGLPEQWATYGGNKIVFRPTPSATGTLLIRHVSKPPDIGVAGPEQLPGQDERLPTYYAAHLFSICYPDSALAMQRSEGLLSRSREEGAFGVRDAEAKKTVR